MALKDNQEQEVEKKSVRQTPEKKEPVVPLAGGTKPPEEPRPEPVEGKPIEAEEVVEEATPPPPTIRREPPPELEPKEVVTVPKPPRPSRPARILRFIRAQIFTRTRVFFQQKVIKPIITRLAKTAVGKAIKEGVKKAGAWVATKLGIQAAVTAAGAATAEISAGLSLLISAAINLAIEVATRVLGKAKGFIKKLFEKPETLIATGVVLGALGFGVTAPISILFWGTGGILIVTGTAIAAPAFVAGATAGVGGFFSSLAAAPAAFFSALGAPISATALVILMIGIIGGLSAATFFQVMTTSSAFILPHPPPEGVGELITVGEHTEPLPPGETGHLAEEVISILKNQCNITKVNITNWNAVESCLNKSSLPEEYKKVIIYHFGRSVNMYKDPSSKYYGLQCVGFVRGIMSALGYDPGGRAAARLYLYSPQPVTPRYEKASTEKSKVQVGDLVVWEGTSVGHIGIVVGREGNYIRIAQAWGNRARAGLLEITTDDIAYFDGFLHPK